MIKVGITGNIGSGKTTVCKMFESLGIPIYYADDRAKMLMNTNPFLIKKIKYLFGPEVYSDQKLNRPFLANIIFNNKTKLNKLNSVVHPAVALDGAEWFTNQNTSYAIKEAALIVETGGHEFLDVLIVVTAPEELRIQRVISRDQVSPDQVTARIKNQLPESEKTKVATYIIQNDGGQSLIPQIYDIHRQLISKSVSVD